MLTFPNISGNALLVVPRPSPGRQPYTHLAAFLRLCPQSEIHRLWQQVGTVMSQELQGVPGSILHPTKALWLSTHGMGVPWLHVRIDKHPKYYHFDPYKAL